MTNPLPEPWDTKQQLKSVGKLLPTLFLFVIFTIYFTGTAYTPYTVIGLPLALTK